MEGLQTTTPEPVVPADKQFHLVASSLAKLVETARRELGRDQEAAKASLATASYILQAEIGCCSGASGPTRGGLAPWQIFRVRAYIDSNLHRTIHVRDLSALARRDGRLVRTARSRLLAQFADTRARHKLSTHCAGKAE
jgi:AraC family transcriptional regulator